ncbi:Sister chromatid cohesion protein pds5 [Escovopsis weberi]|uniref:Sister chromatid cohesion protein pds5 n=1 Tax=Escovopsis weberi TaxID=150374 RepID=A0A0M9VS14_ESCWE|nr:Sister chromatid cohesion protein pds5 [Escovopsis weberi]
MMFGLFIKDILPALYDPSNPYDSQHKYVLVSLTDVKSILLISEIHGADDLLLRLFNSTFDGVSTSSKLSAEEQVAKDVEIHLTDMLMQLIDESPGSVPASVIDAIISQFLRAAPPGGSRPKDQNGKQSTLLHKTEPAAYVMAKNICNGCADKMARYVSQYFSDVILNASGFATKSNGYGKGDESDEEEANAGPSDADLKSLRQAHLLIRELWRAAPAVLQNVIPQLDAELSADNVHLRLIATETFGDMISGIGAAGPPQPPVLDPTAYPPLRLMDDLTNVAGDANVLTKPYSPQSFAQSHAATYRNFVGRRNDKTGTIRAAWVTAVGYILSTFAGGIGLSREEEIELVKGLVDKLNDSEEKVRLAAVKAIELFDFKDVILKLGIIGGVDKEGSVFASLADRCRDRKPAVRVEAMVLLGKLWAVGAGEIADGQEAVTACLGAVPSRIINVFYANDPDLNVLLDRIMYECLIPLKYPVVKGKGGKTTPSSSQGKTATGQADQDRIRTERLLLMLKSLDNAAQKAFFAMQARQPQFAKAVQIFIQQCEAYNGGVIESNDEKVKSNLNKTLQWLGQYFPDPLKVRSDLQKFAKQNDRRSYQLVKYAIESESDFKTVRRAIAELITKISSSTAASSLDTIIPLLYRSSCLMFNRSHLATIMDYSKSDHYGLAGVAHQVLNDISQRNPDIFKAHAEELRKEIVKQAPTDTKPNDPTVGDILKAYSSYSKRYPDDMESDRSFTQTLMNYALYGAPVKTPKYAVNILLAKNDDKSRVTATTLLRKAMIDWDYGTPHFINKLATVSQLERLAPTVTVDSDGAIHDLTIKKILRNVRTDATDKDPQWVDDADIDEELQAKFLSLRILVNQALANSEQADAEERVKAVLKLLKTIVVQEGEFCKVKETPLHHKKRLRLLAGLLILKLCTVKKYDDQLDHAGFNKLAEVVQDTEYHVRRRFLDKLQNYLIRGKLRPRFITILFLVAFEPMPDLKSRVETWLRSRSRYFAENDKQIMEALLGRLIPLLAHHPDYSSQADDLLDFANYLLFYLGAVATEQNISLIYKYAERVKQTRDGVDSTKSDNLYVLSDLAQTVVRKFQEKKNWSFQAFPGKVGLPTGLYTALPSSDIAQQIAKKQYIPDEIDEKLDELIRAIDRKKKRKSIHEPADPPSKRSKTQIKTVIREKPEAKAKPKKPAAKKVAKSKAASQPKKATASPPLPESERRRSSRSHKVSNYAERDDKLDEEEMLEGVAEWDYGVNDEDDQEKGSEPETGSNDEAEEQAPRDSEEEESAAGSEADEGENEEAPSKNGRKAPQPPAKAKGKTAAVKASVLSRVGVRGGRSTRRGTKDTSDMDLDDDYDE